MGVTKLSSRDSVVKERWPAPGKTERGCQLPSKGRGQGRDRSKIISNSVIEERRGQAHGMKGKGLLDYALYWPLFCISKQFSYI